RDSCTPDSSPAIIASGTRDAPRRSAAFELGDVREVPVQPAVVEPVTDDEDVGDREAHVVEVDLHLSALDLVDEDARPETLEVAGLEVALQVRERQPRGPQPQPSPA